ncbi:MAG: response regulator [Ktedonobacteraceae bacterium]
MEEQHAHNVTTQRTITGPILVVDDDQNLRQTIQWVLEDEGHMVETAADGQEAVEQAAQQQPALVILDMGLPILNGAEVAAELRSLYGTAVPIMLITADGHVREKREQVGAYTALRKPFEIDDLVQAVQQVLSDQ